MEGYNRTETMGRRGMRLESEVAVWWCLGTCSWQGKGRKEECMCVLIVVGREMRSIGGP